MSERTLRKLTKDQQTDVLRVMHRIRGFEEKARELFQDGRIKGTAHSSVGQEAIAAGACAVLRADDFVVSHHRGHGHCIAKGARLDRMMAELLGREKGYCRGLGGSMHIAALDLNIYGANGIVGAGIGIGIGAALAARLAGSDIAGIAFFGDGAANEGIFHESMNLGAIWRLPLIFFCENNQYGLSTAMAYSTAGGSVAERAKSYGVPGIKLDGNDAHAVYQATAEALARARAGDGPTLIEAVTYRWGEHSMRANLPRYRAEAEEAEWRERDPIARLERDLKQRRVVTAAKTKEIHAESEAEVEAAVTFAEASDEPSMAVMTESIYAPRLAAVEPPAEGERGLTYAEALNEALHQEMERDPRVFVMGEDVGRIGGIFRVTAGLQQAFGADRVRDTPISEAAIAGAGVGAAIAGQRPVVEIQIFDFVTHMMDMIVNQAAKFRFMLGGRPQVPIVFRGPQGGGVRLAAQHSQSLEGLFTQIPGLTVIAPSTPYDAKGLLTAAIRDDNPVIFLEHKLLYFGQTAPVPVEPYAIEVGKADVKREGSDVTVVATLLMVERALQAATLLERDGISVEVIDPRSLVPLDEEAILKSVRKTNRLVVAHEAAMRGGFGAEVAALVTEQAFDHLDAPVARVAGPNLPMPYNDRLERECMPDSHDIAAAGRAVCYRDEPALAVGL